MLVGVKSALLFGLLIINLSGCVGYYQTKSSGSVEKDMTLALLVVPQDERKLWKRKVTKSSNDERALFLVQKDQQKDSIGKETKDDAASGCVESIVAGTCPPPGVVVADTTGASTVYNCVTSGATAAACTTPDVFDASTSECKVQMMTSCTGTTPSKVGVNSDTRTIYKETKIYNDKTRWCGRTIWAIIPIPLLSPSCRTYTELTFENGEPISAREQYLEKTGHICGPFVLMMGNSKAPLAEGFCVEIGEIE